MKFRITFPKEKKEMIVKGLEDANATVNKHNQSKKLKYMSIILSKALKTAGNVDMVMSDYKIVSDNEIIWNYHILGEELVKNEVITNQVLKIVKRDYGEDVKIEEIKNAR